MSRMAWTFCCLLMLLLESTCTLEYTYAAACRAVLCCAEDAMNSTRLTHSTDSLDASASDD